MKVTVIKEDKSKLLTWAEVPLGSAVRSVNNSNHTYFKLDSESRISISDFGRPNFNYQGTYNSSCPVYYPVQVELIVKGAR